MRSVMFGAALSVALLAAGPSAACDLDGFSGAHRFMPFQPISTQSQPPPVTTPRATRDRPAPRVRADGRRRGDGGRRSDDGEGYASYGASDTSTGAGAPGDADWIHNARDR